MNPYCSTQKDQAFTVLARKTYFDDDVIMRMERRGFFFQNEFDGDAILRIPTGGGYVLFLTWRLMFFLSFFLSFLDLFAHFVE